MTKLGMIRITLTLLTILSLSTPQALSQAGSTQPAPLQIGDTLTWVFRVERTLTYEQGMDVRESRYQLILTERQGDNLVGHFEESHNPSRWPEVERILEGISNEAGGTVDRTYTPNPFEHGSATVLVDPKTGVLKGATADSVIPYLKILYAGRPQQPTDDRLLASSSSYLTQFWMQLLPEVPDTVRDTDESRVVFVTKSESTVGGFQVNANGTGGEQTEMTSTTVTTTTWNITRELDSTYAITEYEVITLNQTGDNSFSTRRALTYDTRSQNPYPVRVEQSNDSFGVPGSTRLVLEQEPMKRRQEEEATE